MISVQQLLPETHVSADYSDTVAAAVGSGPGRAMYIPPCTRGPAAPVMCVPEPTGWESKVQLPQLLCCIEPKIISSCAVCYSTIF